MGDLQPLVLQIDHVWVVTFSSDNAVKKLLTFKQRNVKERHCVVVDPQEQQVRLCREGLLNWVADEDLKTALGVFGKVFEVTRVRWRIIGVGDKDSTSQTVLLKLKSGIKVDDLPHQIRVAGKLAILVAPGRPMQCLLCKGVENIRRECKVPRCSRCRSFGHSENKCLSTHAAAVRPLVSEIHKQVALDAAEAEDAAKVASNQETTTDAPET
ncbi:hypothetical protein HPB51_018489 [Rhipicephalus microplus]|uniref:Uncharacterized protein n=1 Tax=Rhipicephalus microplus TaxID=6941 RepID=A0A9J6EI07_RHIMP|nr:hypothetical protein HPB51_018489 [Rhipicephalus microplus]